MADISSIKTSPTGEAYNIKDATARSGVSAINEKIPSNASSSNKLATASDLASKADSEDVASIGPDFFGDSDAAYMLAWVSDNYTGGLSNRYIVGRVDYMDSETGQQNPGAYLIMTDDDARAFGLMINTSGEMWMFNFDDDACFSTQDPGDDYEEYLNAHCTFKQMSTKDYVDTQISTAITQVLNTAY